MNASTSVEENLKQHRQRRVEAQEPPTGGKPANRRPGRQPADTGRWRTLNTFVDTVLAESSEAEIRVWLVLFRDVRDGLARAGMTDIANRAGLTRRAVTKAIGRLKARGLVEVVTRGSVNGTSNVYRVRSEVSLGNAGSLGATTSLGNHGSPP